MEFVHYYDLDGNTHIVNVGNEEDVLNEVEAYGGRDLRELVEGMIERKVEEAVNSSLELRRMRKYINTLESETNSLESKLELFYDRYDRFFDDVDGILEEKSKKERKSMMEREFKLFDEHFQKLMSEWEDVLISVGELVQWMEDLES